MFSIILFSIAAFCVIGAIQERKDLMRLIGFLCVGAILGIVGLFLQIV